MDAIGKKLIDTYHVTQIIFINSIFALLPISMFITYKNKWKEVKKFNFKIQLARSLCALIAMIIFFVSSHYLPLVTLYSIVFVFPLVLTLGANIFLGESIGWRRYSAIIVGFIGVIIAIDPFSLTFNNLIIFAFLSPVFAAAGWLIIKKYGEQENIFSFMFYGKIFLISITGVSLIFFLKQSLNLTYFSMASLVF